jgi:hypothetical protein
MPPVKGSRAATLNYYSYNRLSHYSPQHMQRLDRASNPMADLLGHDFELSRTTAVDWGGGNLDAAAEEADSEKE